jgi:hypothetical protein
MEWSKTRTLGPKSGGFVFVGAGRDPEGGFGLWAMVLKSEAV